MVLERQGDPVQKTKVLAVLHFEFLLQQVGPQGRGWWLLFLRSGISQPHEKHSALNPLGSCWMVNICWVLDQARPGTMQVSPTHEPLAILEIPLFLPSF